MKAWVAARRAAGRARCFVLMGIGAVQVGMPVRSAETAPPGDGSCVIAIDEMREMGAPAPSHASSAAGRKTGEVANGERLFMDCINLEIFSGTGSPGAVPWPIRRSVQPTDRGQPAPLELR